jgi:signal transduction histidine kinase
VGGRPVRAVLYEDTGDGRSATIGTAAAAAAVAARVGRLTRAENPTPRGGVSALPPAARSEQTAGMRWARPLRRRTRRDWLSAALVLAGLVGFVGLTYVVLVVGGGLLLGRGSGTQVALSVVATAVVALGFDPVLTRLEAYATRVVKSGRPSPYDVMRRFVGAVGAAGPADELPLHMARLLAEGTGAEWAQVWVAVDGRPEPSATWPPDARPTHSPEPDLRTRRLPVRHGDEELGMLVVREREGTQLTPVELRLFADLARQAGLVLRGARLRAALQHRLGELSAREAELRDSRERVVDAQDEARRRLERDIHDGAQQHLVALAVNLRLAASLAVTAPERSVILLEAQEQAAADAVETLLLLSRGIYPPRLEEAGVASALRAAAGGHVLVTEQGAGRYPLEVEAAAYFCGLEAIQNAAKHSGAGMVEVRVDADPDGIGLSVADDGSGFDATRMTAGTGLASIRDRLDSVGGSLEVTTALGQGTRLRIAVPSPALVQGRV